MSLLRDVKSEKEKDDGTGNPKYAPGPGETMESVENLNPAKGEPEDKGDKVKAEPGDGKPVDDEAAAAAKKIMDDAEAAAEAKAGGDDKGDKGDKGDKITVPKYRMDAALVRAREAEAAQAAAEAETAALRAATPSDATKTDDDDDTITIADAEKRVDALDLEIAKQMKDDDDEDGAKLAVLLREQRELRDGILEAQSVEARAETKSMTAEEIQFDKVVDRLEESIPALDPNNKEHYNQELANEAITLANALHAQGNRTQGDSMLLAVDYMGERLGIKGTDTVADVKKETDIAANAAKAAGLPPDVPGSKGVSSDSAGITPDSVNPMSMSDKEFEALASNEQALAKARGDFL